MLVKDYMTRHPLMAQPDMPIVEAQRFMGENNIRHLPIVGDGKRMLGLITRQVLLVDPGRLGSHRSVADHVGADGSCAARDTLVAPAMRHPSITWMAVPVLLALSATTTTAPSGFSARARSTLARTARTSTSRWDTVPTTGSRETCWPPSTLP